MTFRIVRGALADAEIDDFGRYAADYSEDFAREQFARLNRIFAVYPLDDDAKIANVLRFWNAGREPESFET